MGLDPLPPQLGTDLGLRQTNPTIFMMGGGALQGHPHLLRVHRGAEGVRVSDVVLRPHVEVLLHLQHLGDLRQQPAAGKPRDGAMPHGRCG